jgi:hypothetical protein
VESLCLLPELVYGVLVLLDVPLGTLIKGLPVTLWGQVRWAEARTGSLGRWVGLPERRPIASINLIL